eukprot:11549719-Prorocentrum_lima.AAC.1
MGIFGPWAARASLAQAAVGPTLLGRDWRGGEGVKEMVSRGKIRGPLLACVQAPASGGATRGLSDPA